MLRRLTGSWFLAAVLVSGFCLGSLGFAQTSLGSSSSQTATLTFTATGLLNSINVLTQGAPNLDFQYAAGGTCATGNNYSSGGSCTVNVTFAPQYPGLRLGAVVLRDGSGNVLATAYVGGIGNGPLLAFNPGWQTTAGSGFSTPVAAAVDGAGNLYIVDNASGAPVVVKVAAGSGTQTIIGNCPNSTLACTLQDPVAVAVDGAGNVFIADHGSYSEVVKVSADGKVQGVVGGGSCGPFDPRHSCHLDSPTGVAIDGAGNIYISDNGTKFQNPQVLKVSADGVTQTYISPSTWSSGATAHSPMGIAIDAAGNLYITDDGNAGASPAILPQVLMVPVGGGSPAPVNTGSACSLSTAMGVAIDAAGNLYLADPNNHCVVKVPPSGTPTEISAGLVNPQGVAVDAAGNLYISDYSKTQVVKLDRSDAPGTPLTNGVPVVSLPTTASGQQSNPPTPVTVENDGNQPLTFSAITAGTYLLLDGSTTCSTATPLPSANSCNLEIRFAPTAGGTLASSVTLIDNGLNSPQTIATTGNVIDAGQSALSVTGVPAAAQTYGTTFTVGSIGGSGSGAVTLAATGACSISGTTVTMTRGAGTCSVTATKAADSNYNSTTSSPATVSAAPLTLAVTAANQTMTYGSTLPSFTGTLTGVVAADAITASYATTATATSVAGTYPITPALNDPGNKLSNYAVNSSNGTLTITKAGVASAVHSSAATVLLKNNVTFTAHVTSATSGTPTGSVNFMDGSTSAGSATLDNTGTATLTLSTLSAGSHSITAAYAGDSNFNGSTSSVLNQTVQDFQFIINGASVNDSAVAVLSSTVVSGQVATYQFQMSPTNGATFPSAVTLSLSNLPAGVSYTITPSTLAAGSGTQSVTVQVQTARATASLGSGATGLSLLAAGFLLLPMLGIVWLRGNARSRSKRIALVLVALVVIGVLGMTGCGGGGNGFYAHAAQSYTVQLNGASGALQHFTTFGLTVQ